MPSLEAKPASMQTQYCTVLAHITDQYQPITDIVVKEELWELSA